jgi:hypothetical protein
MGTWKGAYSGDDPDFQKSGDNLKSYPSTAGGAKCMSTRALDGFKAGVNLSSQIDVQYAYGYAFDDDKSANWSKEKSRSECGGFAGPVSRSNNHPKKGSA